jgi:hypothetical protein
VQAEPIDAAPAPPTTAADVLDRVLAALADGAKDARVRAWARQLQAGDAGAADPNADR